MGPSTTTTKSVIVLLQDLLDLQWVEIQGLRYVAGQKSLPAHAYHLLGEPGRVDRLICSGQQAVVECAADHFRVHVRALRDSADVRSRFFPLEVVIGMPP